MKTEFSLCLGLLFTSKNLLAGMYIETTNCNYLEWEGIFKSEIRFAQKT